MVVNFPMEDKKTVLNRLNRLEGQIRGIHKMISDERDCEDIVIQLSAVKAGADKIMTMLVMDNLLQTVNTEGTPATSTFSFNSEKALAFCIPAVLANICIRKKSASRSIS